MMKALCPTCNTEFIVDVPFGGKSDWEIARYILDMVSHFFATDADTLKSKSRKKWICHARNIAIYLIRINTGMTFEAIALLFNRNHSTIVYNYHKIRREIRNGFRIEREVEFIESKLITLKEKK